MSKGPLVTDGDLKEAASATAFAADAIERHMSSEMYRNAVTANEYYRQHNVTINRFVQKIYSCSGAEAEDFTASMQQPKVSVRYMFSGEMPYTLKNKMALTFLTQALNSRYLVSIREEKGGTYGVRVQGSTKYIPRETYSMTISFDTNEEMADELREIVMKEIEEIAANGPKSEDIEKNREFMLKSWKNSLEQNGAWMSYIQIKYGSGLNYIADHEQAIRDLTNADVQALAKKILADGNLVKVVMRPSK